jgi:ribosomal protein L37E
MNVPTIGKRTDMMRGDVQCLNCGRLLGAAFRSSTSGATTIRPIVRGEALGVERLPGRGLRCKRCGGRAFIEFDAATSPAPAA